ncbi:MAG TPA: diaminopimelate decarboxylase [Vicinamibacterales bacterium]|nr:diaminopimelate decarboxylase [Vicinamibacterales bacterium]
MTGFFTREGVLTCDEVALVDIASAFGTPTYVYSAQMLTERFQALDRAFADVPHRVHYAIKANSTLAIVRHLRAAGAAADANSGGELEVALRAGFAPSEIVFTGVGKSRAELERAVSLGLAAINAESLGEVERIGALARAQGRTVDVAVRINPDVDAGSHRHISTGSRTTKFGVAIGDAPALVDTITRQPGLRLVGLHVHVGSQITSIAPLARGAAIVADLARELIAQGVPLAHLDLGGGLGIAYEAGQTVIDPKDYAAALMPIVRSTGLTLLLELGRWIVGPAGVLVTEVVDLKRRSDDGWFVIADAGMTDLMRPALYGAYHRVEPIVPRRGEPMLADIVGPVCETTDTLAAGRTIPPVDVGDLLVIRDAGAYGSVMASNYNRRPMAAEVMIENGQPRLIRRRQSIDDMLQWDL